MLEARNTSDRNQMPNFQIGNGEIMIYSWIIYTIVCQTINIFGIITNIINIICFVKQDFKDPVNISLLGLSVSDLASLTTLVLSCAIVPCTVSPIDLPFETLDVIYMVSTTPHFAFTRVSSCITAMITFERCLSVAAPLKIKGIVTPNRTAVIIVVIFVTLTFSAAPMYYTLRLGAYFSLRRNKTTYGFVYRDPREQIERITVFINNFIIPFGAFIMIVICTVIISVKLRLKSEWRETSVNGKQLDRVSNRNKRVAKIDVLISAVYMLCFVPSSVTMLAVAFVPALFIGGKYENVSIVLFGFVYVLESINSAMNIFIYHNMSSKYRDTLKKLFRCMYTKN